MIKAIETRYKGYRFRSRLEARWAVFFDTVGLKWEYEVEGFDINGQYYLPDFRVEGGQGLFWCEIKPFGEIASVDALKMFEFQDQVRQLGNPLVDFVILHGAVWPGDYQILRPRWCQQLKKCVAEFQVSGEMITHCPLCGTIAPRPFSPTYSDGTGYVQCLRCDLELGERGSETEWYWFHKGLVETTRPDFIILSPLLAEGYEAARAARFEHGECG